MEPPSKPPRPLRREAPGEPPVGPKQFADRIVQEHQARRAAGAGDWPEGPDDAALVALAAMATRWTVTADEFEAKLERLARTPTGVARPAATRLLQLWREQRGDVARESLAAPGAAPSAEQTVLVVEDDEMLRELILEILGGEYRVVVAETGQQALDLARRVAPAAITLDLMLPDGHGARILSELKADPATAAIPVVVTSAYTGGLPARHRALVARVLFKPFGPIELLDALRAALGGR